MAESEMNLLELCSRLAVRVEHKPYKQGLLAGKVCAFIMEWAQMIRETGNSDPTIEDWREWANVPVRSAYRKQHEFRLLFAQWHPTPTVLARHVNRAVARGDSGQVVPADLVPA